MIRRLAALLALLAPTLLASVQAQTSHIVYLPLGVHAPYPDCERLADVGLAWLDNSPAGAQADLTNYCASMYYNNSGHDYSTIYANEVPIIWGDLSQHQAAAASVPGSYCGYAIVLNEPGIHGQFYAPLPTDAAQAYVQIRALLPGCVKAIYPNVIIQSQTGQYNSVAYLRAALEAVEAIEGDLDSLYAVGVHLYGAESTTTTTKLSWVAAELAAMGISKSIIITEYGVFDVGNVRSQMQAMTYQAATHSAVEAIFGYTVRNSQSAVPWELDAGPWPVNFSDSGRGWFAGLVQSGGIP